MEQNNSFKVILWVILILLVIVGVVFLVTKDKKSSDENYSDENVVIGEAVVEKIDISMMESFPVQVNILATGYTQDGCTKVGDVNQRFTDGTFFVTLETKKPLDAENCTQVITPFTKTISLSGVVGLTKGVYKVNVNGVLGEFRFDVDNFISETDPIK